ncbi:MAG: hypothetical protein UT63_C0019G0014 [Candidatus Gottesmanbacteria bacterium GW2011_GWC2_39_8]|uniref:PIN domain-containing protein n=1 Tax=Candidatus Gottesmanbacteria bacterium GW2011_GWC2_39_8 TaxID=1618450 RepID=A0A0G0T638_9BACT|nr:MAG: hypothetical protein UT63_C0019G0014 [Candidatus Gottesmanbacteria bacterium GW2011_GWC2_39_8]
MAQNKILDSSVIVALFNIGDSQHGKAKLMYGKFRKTRSHFILHPLVIIESLTVLKTRVSGEVLADIEKILFDKEIFTIPSPDFSLSEESQLLRIFNEIKDLSLVDAILLEFTLEEGGELLTFDKRLDSEYRKNQN